MAWIAVDELREFLRRNCLLRAPRNCPVCNANSVTYPAVTQRCSLAEDSAFPVVRPPT